MLTKHIHYLKNIFNALFLITKIATSISIIIYKEFNNQHEIMQNL